MVDSARSGISLLKKRKGIPGTYLVVYKAARFVNDEKVIDSL